MKDRGSREHLATSVRPVGAGRQLSDDRSLRSRVLLAMRTPPLGGLLGGTSVGVAEALYINSRYFGTQDWSGIVYAVLLYGVIGLAMGCGLSVLAGVATLVRGKPPEPARSWTLSFLIVACALAFVIGRFVLRRDVFAEASRGLGPELVLAGCIAAAALVFYVLVRNALAKTFFSFMTHALGSGTVYLLILGFWLLFGMGTCADNRDALEIAPRPVDPELLDRPNVLLVVVDTLRADALGVYGAPGDPTPRLDAFAASSTVYEQAVTQAPWTRPAFASLLTSTVPCTHQTFRKADTLPDVLQTLPEMLQQHGYTTGAIVNNINVTASFNFGQGFDTFEFLRPRYPLRASETSFPLTMYQLVRLVWERYIPHRADVRRYYRDAEEVGSETIGWLTKHGQSRWFLMVQYMDPHDPYFTHPYDGEAYARVQHPSPALSEAPALEKLYDGEVRYWDEEFGTLVDWLGDHGQLENTLVIVTSDHGEEFGEHGGFWHGNRLYDEAIRVPLVIHYPGEAGRTVKDQVRLIDLAPTISDETGAPHGSQWQGFSLSREYALRESKDRLAMAEADFEGFQLNAVRDPEWKYIANGRWPPGKTRPAEELFFLKSDPGEQQDLVGDGAATWSLERRQAELSALQAAGCGQSVDRGRTLDGASPGDCEMLRSLGYVDIADGLCGPR